MYLVNKASVLLVSVTSIAFRCWARTNAGGGGGGERTVLKSEGEQEIRLVLEMTQKWTAGGVNSNCREAAWSDYWGDPSVAIISPQTGRYNNTTCQ